jgi:hypothetical protein
MFIRRILMEQEHEDESWLKHKDDCKLQDRVRSPEAEEAAERDFQCALSKAANATRAARQRSQLASR